MASKESDKSASAQSFNLSGYKATLSFGPMGYSLAPPKKDAKNTKPKDGLTFAVELVGRVRSLIFDTLFLVLVVMLMVLSIYLAFSQNQIVVEPIKAPKSLTELGYGEDASAHRLMAAIKELEHAAKARRKNLDVIPKSRKVDITIPEIGTLFDTVLYYAKKLLSQQDTLIAGEFVCPAVSCDRTTANLRLRVSGGVQATITVPANFDPAIIDNDPLFRLAALKVLEVVQPYVVAAYYFDRHPDRARSILRRMIRRSEKSSELALAHNLFGAMHLHKGKYEKAFKEFEKATALDPNLAEAYSNWGNAYLAKHDYQNAIEKYEQAIELNPDFASAHANIGDALLRQGQIEKAVKKYEMAIDLDPELAYAYANLGDAHARRGDIFRAIGKDSSRLTAYRKAGDYFSEAVEIQPNLVFAHVSWGNALLKLGDSEAAEARYKTALESAENTDIANKEGALAYVHASLGDLYSWQKAGNNKARDAYQKAFEFIPDNLQALTGLGDAHLREFEYDLSIKFYGRAVAIKKDYSRAFVGLGEAHFKISEKFKTVARKTDGTEKDEYSRLAEEALKKSEAAFRAALDPKKKVLRAYEGLGNLFFSKGEYQTALGHFKTETIINHRAVHAFAGLGNARLKLKEYAAAAKAYQSAIRIKANIGYIHAGLGASYRRLKQPEQAIDSYLLAIMQSPPPSYIFPELGKMLLNRARLDEVFAVMQRWIGVNDNTPQPYIYIGKAHIANEDYAAAAAAFQSALDRAPDPANDHHKTARAQLALIAKKLDEKE